MRSLYDLGFKFWRSLPATFIDEFYVELIATDFEEVEIVSESDCNGISLGLGCLNNPSEDAFEKHIEFFNEQEKSKKMCLNCNKKSTLQTYLSDISFEKDG